MQLCLLGRRADTLIGRIRFDVDVENCFDIVAPPATSTAVEPNYHQASVTVAISVGRALWKLRFLLDGTTRIYQGGLSASSFSARSSLPSFSLSCLARDRYYFQAARRGLLKARGWVGALARGGSGVLQREIPSITPWASYIRDYFSFLSPLFLWPPLFLPRAPSRSLHLAFFFSPAFLGAPFVSQRGRE